MIQNDVKDSKEQIDPQKLAGAVNKRKSAGLTHIGNVRTMNQDAMFLSDVPFGIFDCFYIVADGMGGHKAGDVAANLAVSVFCDYVKDNVPDELKDTAEQNLELDADRAAAETTAGTAAIERLLEKAVQAANERVYKDQESDADLKGMGTTFSACGFIGRRMFYAHIGDSRIYCADGVSLEIITNDHSFVGEMVRSGQLTSEEAFVHPNRNILTRALGIDEAVAVDTGNISIAEDVTLLICSDGLNDMVFDTAILEIMKRGIDISEKAEALLAAALGNGGRDNVTVVLVE